MTKNKGTELQKLDFIRSNKKSSCFAIIMFQIENFSNKGIIRMNIKGRLTPG